LGLGAHVSTGLGIRVVADTEAEASGVAKYDAAAAAAAAAAADAAAADAAATAADTSGSGSAVTFYTPDGTVYNGETHTMDGVTMSGATHTSDSVVLTASDSGSTDTSGSSANTVINRGPGDAAGTRTGDLFTLSDATHAMYSANTSGSSAVVEGYISYTIGSNETPVHVPIYEANNKDHITNLLMGSIRTALGADYDYTNNPIVDDVMSGSFKLPAVYDVTFNNLGYAGNLGATGSNSVGTYTGDLFNLSDATHAMYSANTSGSSAVVEGYISYTIGSDETPINVPIYEANNKEHITNLLMSSIRTALGADYDYTNNPVMDDTVPGTFKLPAVYEISFKGLDGTNDGRVSPTSSASASNSSSSASNSSSSSTGDPVASITGLNLTVDGQAAADGSLVLEFDAGAAITIGLNGTDTADEIATTIAAAVNGAAGVGTATATGSAVAFDFTSATGDYSTATAIAIGAATDVAQAVAEDDSGSSTPAATGDPVASITGLNLTVDGQAAADGSLVLEFDAGAAITIGLNGTDTADEIATTIAAAVNGAAGVGTATATGSDVAFDFTSATGDYSTATAIAIGAATDVAQAVAEDDSSDTDSASDSSTDSASDSSSGSASDSSSGSVANFVVKGAPVASISDNTLTVDGVAAASGDLVLTIAGGADATVTLDGTETGLEIATAIAGAVNGLTSGPAATDNGDGTVTFDFSAVAGDYANATKVSIDYTATTARQELSGAADNARSAIEMIDSAIQKVNIQRSKLGAVSNRLSHTINNLTNISSNLSAAQGGIEDADFAKETTDLAKNQILQQASTAMLAQANASKQNVLSLLQG
jgi:flagellin